MIIMVKKTVNMVVMITIAFPNDGTSANSKLLKVNLI